jgi:hypothetical protein
MNAPIRVNPETYRLGDLQFLAQLKTATRAQLHRMLEVFARLDHPAFAWKRAACERKLGVNRTSFAWLERDEWWLEP